MGKKVTIEQWVAGVALGVGVDARQAALVAAHFPRELYDAPVEEQLRWIVENVTASWADRPL